MQKIVSLTSHLHGNFHGRGVTGGHDANADHITDGYTLQGHRRAVLEAGSIFEVGPQQKLLGKQPARGSGHEKDEPDEHDHRNNYQRSHFQLRPMNFFATWHVTPLTELSLLMLAT